MTGFQIRLALIVIALLGAVIFPPLVLLLAVVPTDWPDQLADMLKRGGGHDQR